jgi:hypothetical protein
VGEVVLCGNGVIAVEDFLFGMWCNVFVLEYISKDALFLLWGCWGIGC